MGTALQPVKTIARQGRYFVNPARAEGIDLALPFRLGPNLYLAQTQPGFDGVAWEEIAARVRASLDPPPIDFQKRRSRTSPSRFRAPAVLGARELGRRNVPDRAGITIFTAPRPEPLRLLRASEDVFAVIGYRRGLAGDPSALERIAAIARDAPYVDQALAARTRLMPGTRSGHRLRYRVIARMAGEQQFRRVDLARAISRGIAERGDRSWRPSPDGADVEFWATLLPIRPLKTSAPPASRSVFSRARGRGLNGGLNEGSQMSGMALKSSFQQMPLVTPSQHLASELILAIRLSDERMRHRDYKVAHLPGSLRPSVAAALALLSQPMPEDVVLDPLCGAGTVLIERAHLGHYRLLIGCDRNTRALSAARENVGPRYKPLELHPWDASALPLPDQSVSKIVTNLPWGIRHGSHEDNRLLYPRILREFHRLIKPGGKIVILTSETRLMSDLITRGLFRPDKILRVSILGANAAVYVSSVPS